jgi:hypothetical protein
MVLGSATRVYGTPLLLLGIADYALLRQLQELWLNGFLPAAGEQLTRDVTPSAFKSFGLSAACRTILTSNPATYLCLLRSAARVFLPARQQQPIEDSLHRNSIAKHVELSSAWMAQGAK